ncbi:MAG: ferredoxin [Victivallaceae bacterium]|jgi:ferredoxin
MKAIVDENTCVGCELCVGTCPEVFVMDGAVAKVIVADVPAELMGSCREAADGCPVNAISIE